MNVLEMMKWVETLTEEMYGKPAAELVRKTHALAVKTGVHLHEPYQNRLKEMAAKLSWVNKRIRDQKTGKVAMVTARISTIPPYWVIRFKDGVELDIVKLRRIVPLR